MEIGSVKALLLLSALTATDAAANTPTDSVQTLQAIEVEYSAPAQGMVRATDGSLSVSGTQISHGMRYLGTADVVRTIQMAPGITPTSDYGGGISIDGAHHTTTAYTLDGARVFYPYRFGGIFSAFNTDHIHNARVKSVSTTPSAPYVAGGTVDVATRWTIADTISGTASVGIISSSLSATAPIGSGTALIASARTSYINTLYGHLVSDDDTSIRYGFNDYNLTTLSKIGHYDMLKVNGMYSTDRLRYNDTGYALNTTLDWENAVGSVNYRHDDGRLNTAHTASLSYFASETRFAITQAALTLPSSVTQSAVAGEALWRDNDISLGYRLEYTRYTPLWAKAEGMLTGTSTKRRLEALLASFGGTKRFEVSHSTAVEIRGRMSAYHNGSYNTWTFDPAITIDMDWGDQSLAVSAFGATQYAHHVGLSDIGLASNFYLPASSLLPPLTSYGLEADYTLGNSGHCLWLTAKAYVRGVWDASEYIGDVLSVLDTDYNPYHAIEKADGYDAGGSVSLNYARGGISGWCSYSLGVARRRFDDRPNQWVSAQSEPLHSVKALAQWHVSRSLTVSGYFIMASGRTYTPVRAIYIVGGNILTEYGARNSGRLPLYHRLDISATYTMPKLKIGTLSLSNYLNLSLMNAYGHRNIEMQYFTYDDKRQNVSLRRVPSLYRFMPSVSYTVEF